MPSLSPPPQAKTHTRIQTQTQSQAKTQTQTQSRAKTQTQTRKPNYVLFALSFLCELLLCLLIMMVFPGLGLVLLILYVVSLSANFALYYMLKPMAG
jgi:hypothetical protein